MTLASAFPDVSIFKLLRRKRLERRFCPLIGKAPGWRAAWPTVTPVGSVLTQTPGGGRWATRRLVPEARFPRPEDVWGERESGGQPARRVVTVQQMFARCRRKPSSLVSRAVPAWRCAWYLRVPGARHPSDTGAGN